MKTQENTWDAIAPSWSKFRTRASPIVEEFLKEQEGNILDLGCGSGRNFIAGDQRTFYAVDFSKKMLQYAQKRAQSLRIHAKIFHTETNTLPFEDNLFDATLCWAVLHCIESEEKRERTILEIYRTLNEGGQALISTWGRNSPRLANKNKECLIPWTQGTKEKEERYTYIYDLEEFRKQLEDAGFKIVKIWEDVNINAIVEK